MQTPHVVSPKEWLHGEVRCPECRLHLNAQLDLGRSSGS